MRSNDAPAELAAQARAILARREVRATLADLERAGATVRYAALDITDREALRRELAAARQEWGPITGLIHGAGVIADKRIADKTDDQFDRVYATKVAGLRALLDATASDPLELLCVFSSVAARYGNPGQCDYAMANEVLNQVACAEQQRRPSCRVRALGWGPWEAGMVTASYAAYFTSLGVPLIPLAAGAQAFVAELGTADDAAQVLLTAVRERDGDLLAAWAVAGGRRGQRQRAHARLPDRPRPGRRTGAPACDGDGVVRRCWTHPLPRPLDLPVRHPGSEPDRTSRLGGRWPSVHDRGHRGQPAIQPRSTSG